MIKIENTQVLGWEHAIRGMRNPMNSWDRSDSRFPVEIDEDGILYDTTEPFIGDNDLNLMKRLVKAGSAHAKFKRMLMVYVDVTCHHTWWAEFDTYEHTVRNSCSKMHKIHVKKFEKSDFSHEGIDEVSVDDPRIEIHFENTIEELEWLRCKFNDTQEKKYWRAMIEILPMGYNIKATLMLNYEVLTAIYRWRRHHKIFEWEEFCKWIEDLPCSEIITGGVTSGEED